MNRNKVDPNETGREKKKGNNVNNINGNINESINITDSKNDSNVTTGQNTNTLYQKETNSSLVGGTMSPAMVGRNSFYPDKSLNLKINDLSVSQDYLGSSNISMLSSTIPYKEEGLCFIKYIIVCNFKSYENENVIGPFSKFTAIIGPNGSGKSNLMDCICFVLGINNKYLRAKNLKNLIYHKENEKLDVISKRKCYVKLIIERNKENVEIKRTLNYKGVSNFYINDKLVDHKEYTTFLRKNRIETKTKTCLIFQGDIEDIINKKPTELAKLFEYISGSDEYEQIYEDVKEKLKEKQISCKNYLNDKKKIEQEIKLHKALINKNIEHSKMKEDYELEIKIYYLFRLYHYHKSKEKFKEMLLHLKDEKINFEEDVLSTNKNNANELERKRLLKKKEYLKIDDEIKNYKNELNKQKIGLNEISEKRKFSENFLNKIIANDKIQTNMQNHCSSFLDNLNEQIKEQNKKLNLEYQKNIDMNKQFLNKYENIKNWVKQNHSFVYDFYFKEGEKSGVVSNPGRKSKHKGGEKNALSLLDKSNNVGGNSNNQMEWSDKYNIIDLIENLDEYKECKEKYYYLCANSNVNINNYTNLTNSIKKDIKELQEECDNMSRKKQKEELELKSEKYALDEINLQINKLNNLIISGKEHVETNKVNLKTWADTILLKEKKIEQIQEDINILNIHKNELNYYEKRKEVIKNLKNQFGENEIYDEVCNLYEVTNPKYYTAVNNAIQKYNNFIVVRNIDSCTKCIKYLKDNKLYRMDFIPYENFIEKIKKKKKNIMKSRIRMKGNDSYDNGDNDGELDDPNELSETDNMTFNQIDKVINSFRKRNVILASNCLLCNEKYKMLFDYLIGENTLIVEKIKDAEDIKQKFPNLYVNIVTFNGHIISKHNNLIIDITSNSIDKERFNNKRLSINLYNKLLNEKDECYNSINELNKKIIETNEMLNKDNNELELNKKKVGILLIKQNIFEKSIEAKSSTMYSYEDKIEKLQNIDLKKKIDILHNYEKELLKERNGLSFYQKDCYKDMNKKFNTDNIYEIVEHNKKIMEQIAEQIERIENNIKKINDDINELLDKKNEINITRKNEKKIGSEEDVKKKMEQLKKEEMEINKKIEKINSNIIELENKKLDLHKHINSIDHELNMLREQVNSSFEKHEQIENKIENCIQKI
uniref:SMC hinge domain-containing protein n=1 Tax=Piliocolobus tephrosceles TaxID=591936 RepID=A0A8C9HUV7_9PRIM